MSLHLRFALNLDTIADEMIDQVAKVWDDPFNAPTLIFSEYKLEQWFRLKWLEKKGVLANLNRKSIDKFLFEILGGDDKNVKKLSTDMVRNVIIAYLQKLAVRGKENFAEELNNRTANYLFTGNASIDEMRLFDFANKLAGLFLEYETSRPSKFIKKANGEWEPGILDCWKQGELNPFFVRNGIPVENEEWERKLYSAIFHAHNGKDSLLTDVFKKTDRDCTYLTLPFMYEACKDNGKPIFQFDASKPVFILGLAGMGQFYRGVLQEFSKEYSVYAYIQNPCMAFWEDVPNYVNSKLSLVPAFNAFANPEDELDDVSEFENSLLKVWGHAGRDNIRLWSMANDYQDGFKEKDVSAYAEEMQKQNKDSLLHEMQWMIANRTNKFSEGYIPRTNIKEAPFGELKDHSLTITAAPNRIREVEAVHSQICQLLKAGANIRDVLVVCPNLTDYCSSIYQVFDQAEKGSATNVALKFVIVDSSAKESLVGEALKELFAVKKKGALSRAEFFALVRNPVVQSARRINAEDISDWESWISGMNIFRDHTAESNAQKDWLKGVKRLLLARLTDSCVAGEYLPYADMESANDSKLNRFIDAVESLESWLDDKKFPTLKSNDDFLKMHEFLCSWLLIRNALNELGGESIVFENVQKALEGLKSQLAAGLCEISWNMVAQTLLEAAQNSEYSCGSPLINGITFMKFAPNRTIPIKHLFFMGANAKDFPEAKSFDSLDLRKSVARWPGDDTAVEKNRYAFLCQFMSTDESFHISYQSMYLPKDEELYPSSVVNDLLNALQMALPEGVLAENVIPKIELKIDENRPRSELFTARENRNKDTLSVFHESEEKKVKMAMVVQNVENQMPQERVSTYQIRKFLEDPFEFQVNRVMKFDEAEEDPEKMALEPIALNALDKSLWLRSLVAEKLNIPFEENEKIEKETLLLKGSLPTGIFGEKIWKSLEENAENFVAKIYEKYPEKEWNFQSQKIDVPIECREIGKTYFWSLVGKVRIMATKENQSVLIDIKNRKASSVDFLSNYIAALGLITEGLDSSFAVEIFDNSKISGRIDINQNQELARKNLISIYEMMYGKEKNWKALPMSLFSCNTDDFKTRREYWEKIQKDAWKYFDGKKLFDLKNDGLSGFSQENFFEMWLAERKKMLDRMPEIGEKFLKQKRMITGKKREDNTAKKKPLNKKKGE